MDRGAWWARAHGVTPAACFFPGENARSWEALGEARPGQSSLSAGALRGQRSLVGCSPWGREESDMTE